MSNEPAEKPPFHKKGLTSFIVAWTFLLLVITGCVLYASPKGRVAQWTDWTVLGLDKEEWSGVHMLVALAFVIAGGFHLYFNWSTFLSYFKARFQAGFNLKRELAVATGLTVIVVAGTILGVPPFSSVIAWNDNIKDYWESKSAMLAYPHAEESSLEAFCQNMGISLDEVVAQLKAAGYEVPDTSTPLRDLAEMNGTSPSAMFTEILQGKQMGAGPGTGGMGSGHGRKSLQQVSEELGVPVEDILAALRARGVEAKADDKLKDVAGDVGMRPGELLDVLSASP